jgi:hypothetical protein
VIKLHQLAVGSSVTKATAAAALRRHGLADLNCGDGLHEALLAADTQPGRMSSQLIISLWRRERSMFARRKRRVAVRFGVVLPEEEIGL